MTEQTRTSTGFDQQAFLSAAEDLCSYGRLIYNRDWCPATSSNFSVRLTEDLCALTSSGKHKGELKPEDILVVDMDGQPQSPGKPSAETGLHTQLYRRDSGIGAVLHTHSRTAVILSQIWPEQTIVLTGWELQKALAGETTHESSVHIPVFDNDQNIPRLSEQVESWMQSNKQGQLYLIRGHGLYTWGKDLAECYRHLEAIEHLLDYQLELKKLGIN